MRRLACLTLLTALALTGCGGDGDSGPSDPGRPEAAVRDYLRALVAKRGADACATFTPEYQRSLLRQFSDLARREGVDDCAGVIDAVAREVPKVTFEGEPLRSDMIDDIELKTTVRQSGEEHNATVTGERGIQRYDLETRDGRWFIANIEFTG